jgi:hypothetical protein
MIVQQVGIKYCVCNINKEKTKYTIVGKTKITGVKKKEIQINKYTFENVDNLKYLGVMINEINNKDFEIQERIKNANKAYFMLQNIFKCKNISKNTKISLKNSVINKILSYGSE